LCGTGVETPTVRTKHILGHVSLQSTSAYDHFKLRGFDSFCLELDFPDVYLGSEAQAEGRAGGTIYFVALHPLPYNQGHMSVLAWLIEELVLIL
jgi:hypothetical protein